MAVFLLNFIGTRKVTGKILNSAQLNAVDSSRRHSLVDFGATCLLLTYLLTCLMVQYNKKHKFH